MQTARLPESKAAPRPYPPNAGAIRDHHDDDGRLLAGSGGAGTTTWLRVLARAAHHRYAAMDLVLAPTGQAVDVAMPEGAGDDGMTTAKALHSLRDGALNLQRSTLVGVDEAGMVRTDDLRQLLTATTQVGVKTVLVGGAHQLAPVKARGGMFAQLCTDLPWTQHLSEVWRMTDPEERRASLALRDGESRAHLRRPLRSKRIQPRNPLIVTSRDAATTIKPPPFSEASSPTTSRSSPPTTTPHKLPTRHSPKASGMSSERAPQGSTADAEAIKPGRAK